MPKPVAMYLPLGCNQCFGMVWDLALLGPYVTRPVVAYVTRGASGSVFFISSLIFHKL